MSETLSPVPATPTRRAGRRAVRRGPWLRQTLTAYVFIAPFMLFFVAMFVLPLAYTGYLSLFREQLIGGTVFAGFGNYRQALGDPLFREGVLRMARFLAVQVPVMLAISLTFALILDSGRLRLARLIRLGIFVPYAVPGVIAALMWGYLYGPDFGPFAQLARHAGLGTPGFLTHRWMLASMANVVTWEFVGYNMIIMFAALQAVPKELYEAASVDGASPVQVAWHVKIPAIRPALLLTLIFSVIGTFQLFNEPKLFGVLAPNAVGTSYSPNLYVYNLVFVNQQLNYSAAVSFLLGIVIVVVSYLVLLATNRRNRQP
jgi:multiple sugar transport system permease protein